MNMRNFFKKSGRSKDLIKSWSLPADRSSACDGRTAADGDSVASNGHPSACPSSSDDADNVSLRAAEQFCDNQNDDFWQRRQQLIRPIARIVTDRECLGHFVQFLDTKSALPLIKFYIDADSFKSSAEVCSMESGDWRWRSPVSRRPLSANSDSSDVSAARGKRRVLSKSVSLNIGRDRDDAMSLNAYSESLDHDVMSDTEDAQRASRDVGDGSSQTNSMSNVSEICDYGPSEFRGKIRADGHGDDGGADDVTADASQVSCEKQCAVSPSPRNDVAEGKANPTPVRMHDIHTDLATDAKRIFHKYLIGVDAPCRVEVPAALLSKIITGLAATSITAIASIFVEAQQYVLSQLENDYLEAFLESGFYHSYCIDTLTGDTVDIADILHNESALFYFMEFVEQEQQREYLDFWISAVNFRRQFAGDAYDTDPAQSDALILYDKFFSLQATHPLRMTDRIRYGVEERICAETGRIDDCFDVPLVIVERYFAQRHLQTFIRSPLFERFVGELRRKTEGHTPRSVDSDVVDAKSFGARGHRKSNSDGGSGARKVSGVRNTLLAMDGTRKRSGLRGIKGPPSHSNMLIDSRQLDDPDLLWRRNTLPGLSFGRIDALGRYERNYETAPAAVGNVDSSKLKQAVRKLVNLREDSAQQEIAWQVAEMIVKEITSVTLNRTEAQL